MDEELKGIINKLKIVFTYFSSFFFLPFSYGSS